jgi:hypothetical protein
MFLTSPEHQPSAATLTNRMVIGLHRHTGNQREQERGILRFLRRSQFVLDTVGLIIAAGLFAASVVTESPVRDIIVGVGTSFVFVALVDLLLATERKLIQHQRSEFFGRELTRDRTVLVYPDFVMHDAVRETLKGHNQQMLYQRPASRFPNRTIHRIDIPRAVAANDIEALLHVADIFESTTTCPNIMLVDREVVDRCDCSFVSFGLSSSDCTHLYIHEHSRPLFTIVEDGSGSEFITLRNGHEYHSTSVRQFGIILRYSPSPYEYPERRWFLCAGIGPIATPGAAWYLSRHWRILRKQVAGSQNFIAVISVGPYTDRSPHLEEVLTDD